MPFQENTELIELLDEMSLTEGRGANGDVIVKEQFLCREPEERVFYKGRWYDGLYLHAGESEEDKRQFAEFQKQIDHWVNWRDATGKTRVCRAVGELFGRCGGDGARQDLVCRMAAAKRIHFRTACSGIAITPAATITV